MILVGLSTLIGWQFHVNFLKRPVPQLVAMNPLTAISFVITGISFLLLSANKNRKGRYMGYTLAALVILVSITRLAGTLLFPNFRIDHLFFYKAIQADALTSLSSSMAINTAVAFIFSGTALLLINYETPRHRMPSHILSLLVFLFGFFSILGYIYSAPEFYNLLRYLPMALHTAVCFLLVSLAILLVYPGKGISKELFRAGAGGAMARLFVPVAIIVPVLLGLLRVYTHKADLFSTELGITLLILSIVLVFCGLIGITVVLLNQKDILRDKTEKKFRNLLEAAPDAIIIMDQAGIIQVVNAQGEKMFGYEKQELIGQRIEILMPERYRSDHPTHRDGYFANPKVRGMGTGLELYGRKKDGSEFFVEISLSPIETDDGLLVSAAIRDITERKRIEEHTIFLASIADNIQDPVVSVDNNSMITRWNEAAERLFEWKSEEVIGKKITDILDVLYPTQPRVAILESFEEAGFWQGELIYHTKSGTPLNVLSTASHLKDNHNNRTGYFVLIRDITDRKKSEELLQNFNKQLRKEVNEKTREIEETNKQLRQLSAHLQIAREEERKYIAREIHDEFGQMLTGLKLDIVWLKKNTDAPNNNIAERFERALELLNETRKTIRRISTDLHPAVLDDLGLIAALELHIRDFENRSGIKTYFTTDINNIRDEQIAQNTKIGLYRVFQESLTNVAKHAEAEKVSAFLKTKDQHLVLNISDNGKGFDVDAATYKKTLGLISIRERALMMGGTYEIHSIPGEGTTILLTVPFTTK